MLKKLRLTAGRMLRWRGKRESVTQVDAAQQAAIASRQRRKGTTRGCETEMIRAMLGSSSSCDGGEIFREPKKNCVRKEYGFWLFRSVVRGESAWTLNARRCCSLEPPLSLVSSSVEGGSFSALTERCLGGRRFWWTVRNIVEKRRTVVSP